MKWIVKYEVDGFDGERQAGPYTLEEAHSHHDDIRGFEGVRNARIAPDPGSTQAIPGRSEKGESK